MVSQDDQGSGKEGGTESVAKRRPRRREMLVVRVIEQKGESALIEWALTDDVRRGYVPATEIDGDKCPIDVVEAAIPYGVPWESLIKEVSATEIAKHLRKRGIWTSSDIERNPKAVTRAIDDATGLHFGALHGIARQYEKGR